MVVLDRRAIKLYIELYYKNHPKRLATRLINSVLSSSLPPEFASLVEIVETNLPKNQILETCGAEFKGKSGKSVCKKLFKLTTFLVVTAVITRLIVPAFNDAVFISNTVDAIELCVRKNTVNLLKNAETLGEVDILTKYLKETVPSFITFISNKITLETLLPNLNQSNFDNILVQSFPVIKNVTSVGLILAPLAPFIASQDYALLSERLADIASSYTTVTNMLPFVNLFIMFIAMFFALGLSSSDESYDYDEEHESEDKESSSEEEGGSEEESSSEDEEEGSEEDRKIRDELYPSYKPLI